MKTDHVSLQYLLEQRLTHTLQHKKGSENQAADALKSNNGKRARVPIKKEVRNPTNEKEGRGGQVQS